MLELARLMVDSGWNPPRPIIFLFNGAEELFMLVSTKHQIDVVHSMFLEIHEIMLKLIFSFLLFSLHKNKKEEQFVLLQKVLFFLILPKYTKFTGNVSGFPWFYYHSQMA